jgi:cell division transport system permease protein
LTVLARRPEIEVMRLVGATAWFIRWPFVVEGAVTGALAGFAAMILVTGAYGWIAQALPFLPLSPLQVALELTWKVLLWGIVIGIGGSLLAVRRFLSL